MKIVSRRIPVNLDQKGSATSRRAQHKMDNQLILFRLA